MQRRVRVNLSARVGAGALRVSERCAEGGVWALARVAEASRMPPIVGWRVGGRRRRARGLARGWWQRGQPGEGGGEGLGPGPVAREPEGRLAGVKDEPSGGVQ